LFSKRGEAASLDVSGMLPKLEDVGGTDMNQSRGE
jgi:hypothetical protein